MENVIDGLPNGLNTLYDDNHVQLSGGQKQRIEIARALYHEQEIIVMDEATSHLDKENSLFIENLLFNKPDLLVIMISHHIHDEIRPLADKIIHLTNFI